jgi:hypothetical protein
MPVVAMRLSPDKTRLSKTDAAHSSCESQLSLTAVDGTVTLSSKCFSVTELGRAGSVQARRGWDIFADVVAE